MLRHGRLVRQGRWKGGSLEEKRRRIGRILDNRIEIWLRGICSIL